MIILENLSVFSTIDLHQLIDNLSVVLNSGEKAAIVGEEGNGKSTLLKLLCDGDCAYANFSGKFALKGKVCFLKQELDQAELFCTAADFFEQNLDFFNVDGKKLAKIAKKFNFDSDIFWSQRKLNEFSGGERVKIQLLKLALSDADIFLLDEPSNDIDLETLEWLEQFISNTKATVLYVSHDQTLLQKTATTIIHLEQAMKKSKPVATIFRGSYDDYVEFRYNALARQQQLHNKETQQFDAQLQKYQRIYQSVHHAQKTVSRADPATGRLLKKKMHSVKALEKRLEKQKQGITPKTDVEQAIDIEFAETNFPRGKTVLRLKLDKLEINQKILCENIDLTVFGGEKIVILGKNGSGKTTLLKKIYQTLKDNSDLIVGYMPQNYSDQMDFNQTAVEYLSQTTNKDKTFVRGYLGSANFTSDEMSHQIGQLSGGQKAKLYFLMMILKQCNCLILDEPTRNFSPLSVPVITNALSTFDGTVIATSHDRSFIEIFDKKLYL